LRQKLLDFEGCYPQIQILPTSWKPLIYTSILLAIKYWDDIYFWNVDVVNRLKMFDVKTTNDFENMFLRILDFNMWVDPSIFEQYFIGFAKYKVYYEEVEDIEAS